MVAYTDNQDTSSDNIRVNTVTMYTKNNCEFCEKAKNLLHSSKNYVIHEVQLDKEPQFIDSVKEKLGNTVPQIIINGVHVGGYDNLVEYLEKWN